MHVSQIFSAPPSGETMRQTPKVLEVQERRPTRGPDHHAVWWGSDFTRIQKREFFVCMCLSVTLAN